MVNEKIEMEKVMDSHLSKCDNAERRNAPKEVNSKYLKCNAAKIRNVFESTRGNISQESDRSVPSCFGSPASRATYHVRRIRKHHPIGEREMQELEEKVVRTEKNIQRLQNLTLCDNIEKLPKNWKRNYQVGGSTNLNENIYHKKYLDATRRMPVFIAEKYEKFCSNLENESTQNKDYDSLSILMDGGCDDNDSAERLLLSPPPTPPAGAARARGQRWPGFSASVRALWTPPASPRDIDVGHSIANDGSGVPPGRDLDACVSLPSLPDTLGTRSAQRSVRLSRSQSDLSDLEVRPTSRISGVMRFVEATAAHDDAALFAANGFQVKPIQREPSVGYMNVLRGVMLQDKGAVQALKKCVKDLQKLQKKMESVQIVDEYSYTDYNSVSLGMQKSMVGRSPLFCQNVSRNESSSCNLGNEINENNMGNIDTHAVEDPILPFKDMKSDILDLYGKDRINTMSIRKLEERTRWKF